MWFVSSIILFIASVLKRPTYNANTFKSWGLNYDWEKILTHDPPCITFSIPHDTTCNDMCLFCKSTLDSNSFYFTDNVCKQNGVGNLCFGSPTPSTNYTCCSN